MSTEFFLAVSWRSEMVEDDLARLTGGRPVPFALCMNPLLVWLRPALAPRVAPVTLRPSPAVIDWLSSGFDSVFQPPLTLLSRDRDVITPVDDVMRPVLGCALLSSDIRLLVFEDAAADSVLAATGCDPPLTSLVILLVRDAAKLEALSMTVFSWPHSTSLRFATIEAVVFVTELRRWADTDVGVVADSLDPAFLASAWPMFALLTRLLLAGRATADVFILSTLRWLDFDAIAPTDCRLIAAAPTTGMALRWRGALSCSLASAAVLRLFFEVSTASTFVFDVCSGSESDFEFSLTSVECSAVTSVSFPFSLSSSASEASLCAWSPPPSSPLLRGEQPVPFKYCL